ncbi:Uncharacterized protein SCF082_LOCUS3650 [Durusdinium trenchii]|uniref:Sulfotransferase n=1 Tax=Durusdinium trenchii TaxID=1381693 RepID=A0ABP0HXC0_9DINO
MGPSILARGLRLLTWSVLFATGTVSRSATAERLEEVEQVDLLQRNLELQNSPLERRRKASPMFWLHIPKCGTSFANTVMHLPQMCPGLKENVSLGDVEIWSECFEVAFWKLCPTLCDQSLVHCNRWPDGEGFTGIHQLLTDEKYSKHKGHLVALFRQPEQRLLSAYYDDRELFRTTDFVCSCCDKSKYNTDELSMEAFIQTWGSWETGQLVGKDASKEQLSLADVAKALERLEDGFAFVGLQEEWELSVCLFHTKFGGPCLAVDFDDIRPTRGQNSSTYDVHVLNGWTDDFDRKVYAKAKNIFESDLLKFGVSHETCKACYEEAGMSW